MHYLGRWRMQLAARALEEPGTSIAAIAADVGYQSEAAFNRAFKKYVGVPPGEWRRARRPGYVLHLRRLGVPARPPDLPRVLRAAMTVW